MCRQCLVDRETCGPVASCRLGFSVVLVALLVGLLCGRPVARAADDLPADTDRITSLTPAQAARLVAEFEGVKVREHIVPQLPLSGLETLDVDTAEELAAWDKGPLLLDGLTTLDADVARALARYHGALLSLDGISELSPEAAQAFERFMGGRLALGGLTTLSVEAARSLATLPSGELALASQAALSADAARELARFGGWRLKIVRLPTLSTETAGALAEFEGLELSLGGPITLSADAARALAGFAGNTLALDGVVTLSPDAARALAGFKGGVLSLAGLAWLSADSLRALAESKAWKPVLPSLTVLDAETARVLATLDDWDGTLPAITAFDSPDIARALAERRRKRLYLPGLTRISADSLRALARSEAWTRSLRSLTVLDAETAEVLATLDDWDGLLPGITAFETPDSVAVATHLATRKGAVSLPNLARISPNTLIALVKNKDDVRIPPLDELEMIAEPDSGRVDDFVVPKWLEEWDRRQAMERAMERKAGVAAGFCWVAREVYGNGDPRWLAFRRWVLTVAPPWFRGAYGRHGPAAAAWLRARPVAKAVVRSWMDSVLAARPACAVE